MINAINKGLKSVPKYLVNNMSGHSLANLNDFNQDFQNFISRFAWGEVWSREGLPRHTRSLVTIAILLALGREDELRMHLRACFNNGVTKDELKELILHSSLYAGLPAANAAMHMAEDVFKELGIEVQPIATPLQD